ncbi:MAG: diaminopimelate decarboxylase [Thermacetogeniaceae bacterium]
MRLQGTMKINSGGHLEIGGCDIVDLARSYGTPLQVIDEELLRRNCREYREAFRFDGQDDLVFYASKALLVKALSRIIQEEGLGLDVVSGGELFIALQAGFPPENIVLHGNNKSPSEMEYALASGVGRIVIDNYFELETLARLAEAKGCRPAVLLRVAPGIEAHSHEYIRTGQTDSKFGFTLANGDVFRAVQVALKATHLNLKGLHCHIGSQILELEAFRHTAAVMVELLQSLHGRYGWTAAELDLGGGLGVYYTAGDEPPAIAHYAAAVRESVEQSCREHDYPRPRILVEPGRSVISTAGATIYTIGAIKDIPGVRKYVSVDGGMNDNPRPALYQAKYEGLLVNKASQPPQEVVTVSGRCCESGDILIWDLHTPLVASGDLLAISCTGAYTYSMSSNYNCLPRPAMVLARDGHADLIVSRETCDDLVKHHQTPGRLAVKGAVHV